MLETLFQTRYKKYLNGHELSDDNIYSGGNSRQCRTCRRDRNRKYEGREPIVENQ